MKLGKSALVLAAIAVAVTTACATVVVEATRMEPRPRSAKPGDSPIEVLEEPIPTRPHKVIGSVRARVKLSETTNRLVPPARVVEELKREARRLGGDALLPITTSRQAGGGTYATPSGILAGSSVVWAALVIAWEVPPLPTPDP